MRKKLFHEQMFDQIFYGIDRALRIHDNNNL